MLQQVTSAIISLEDQFGQEAIFAECEAIYGGKFRSQPERAADSLDGEWSGWKDEFLDLHGVDLTPETLVCCIVNYKGEDDGGMVPFSAVGNLQVFHGKYDYR